MSLLRLYIEDIARHPILSHAEVVGLAYARDGFTGVRDRAAAAIVGAAEDHRPVDCGRITAAVRRAIRAEAGRKAAVGKIVTGNLRLVVMIARVYHREAWRFDDVVAAGNVGLVRAAQLYDQSKGLKFTTYAAHWIKQAIHYSLHNDTTIHTPHHLRLHSGHRLAPIAAAARAVVHLDANIPTPEAREDGTPAQVEELERAAALAEAIGRLPEREAAVLRLRLESGRKGKPMTLEEVGQAIGVTKERVRQIEKAARRRLEQDECLRAAVGA